MRVFTRFKTALYKTNLVFAYVFLGSKFIDLFFCILVSVISENRICFAVVDILFLRTGGEGLVGWKSFGDA